MTNTKKGFTLIELLIVITIIGILAAALLPNILGAPARARDAARQADLTTIISALEAYAADTGAYPTTGGCVDAVLSPTLDAYFPGGAIPEDPSELTSGTNCGDNYSYCPTDNPNTSYVLVAGVEQNETNGNYDDGTTAIPDCSGGPITAPNTASSSVDTNLLLRIN